MTTTYNPLEGLNARQIQRIFTLRAEREAKKIANRKYEADRINAERQEELKAILQLCRTEGEVEVPAVCYECGVEGKCLVVDGDDSDWFCLDCSCW
jgi:RecJ-like exonuclease